RPGHQKEPTRAVNKEEAKRSPSIAKSTKVRRVRLSAVRVKCNRHFGDPGPVQARFDDHLGGKLHPGASLIQGLVVGLRKAPQSTVETVHWRAEPAPGKPRKSRVAEPPVKRRHCARNHGTAAGRQAAALDKIESLAELVQELGRLRKVVAVVSVAH